MQNQEGVWRRWFRMNIVTANLVWISPNNQIKMCISQSSIREAQDEWWRILIQYIGVRRPAMGGQVDLAMLISQQPYQQLRNKVERLGPAGKNRNPGGSERVTTGPQKNKVDSVSVCHHLQLWGHGGCRRRKHLLPHCLKKPQDVWWQLKKQGCLCCPSLPQWA